MQDEPWRRGRRVVHSAACCCRSCDTSGACESGRAEGVWSWSHPPRRSCTGAQRAWQVASGSASTGECPRALASGNTLFGPGRACGRLRSALSQCDTLHWPAQTTPAVPAVPRASCASGWPWRCGPCYAAAAAHAALLTRTRRAQACRQWLHPPPCGACMLTAHPHGAGEAAALPAAHPVAGMPSSGDGPSSRQAGPAVFRCFRRALRAASSYIFELLDSKPLQQLYFSCALNPCARPITQRECHLQTFHRFNIATFKFVCNRWRGFEDHHRQQPLSASGGPAAARAGRQRARTERRRAAELNGVLCSCKRPAPLAERCKRHVGADR